MRAALDEEQQRTTRAPTASIGPDILFIVDKDFLSPNRYDASWDIIITIVLHRNPKMF